MMIPSYPKIVFGYHGCDREVGESVLAGKTQLTYSKNRYDWLGSGVYFWENSPARAWDWAETCASNPRLTQGRIKDPFVIGAIIDLGQCLNLTDVAHMSVLREAYKQLEKTLEMAGGELPKNSEKGHQLDCLVINTAVKLNEEKGNSSFDTVRGAYIEGDPIYPNAKIFEKTHLQLCVRNLNCILGYFKPAL